ncbi:MAG: hypothetical protein M1829_002437 [Trizodia sp. TS-e1964]|nr:MAG: hypothetical protein M1829_002437 [Trizodia sp. TS-e1964]
MVGKRKKNETSSSRLVRKNILVEEAFQPPTSPYTSKIWGLKFGNDPNPTVYYVHEEFLRQSRVWAVVIEDERLAINCDNPSFININNINAPDIHNNLAHTIVHFLVTGNYETLTPENPSYATAQRNEEKYQRELRLYSVARNHGLAGLEELIKIKLETFALTNTLLPLLKPLEEIYLTSLNGDVWLTDYIKSGIRTILSGGNTLSMKDVIEIYLGSNAELNKLVAITVVEGYEEAIKLIADISKVDQAVEVVPDTMAIEDAKAVLAEVAVTESPISDTFAIVTPQSSRAYSISQELLYSCQAETANEDLQQTEALEGTQAASCYRTSREVLDTWDAEPACKDVTPTKAFEGSEAASEPAVMVKKREGLDDLTGWSTETRNEAEEIPTEKSKPESTSSAFTSFSTKWGEKGKKTSWVDEFEEKLMPEPVTEPDLAIDLEPDNVESPYVASKKDREWIRRLVEESIETRLRELY